MQKIITILLFCTFCIHSSYTQTNPLKWVVEGSLMNSINASGDVYHFKESSINNPIYQEGQHPFVWGYCIVDNPPIIDTFDFEILVDSLNLYQADPDAQLTVNFADSSMDLQTEFRNVGLEQEVRLRFNLFDYQTRVNSAFQAGVGGIPIAKSLGLTSPNEDPTNTRRLLAAETYYIEDVLSSASPTFTVNNPCNQLDVVKVEDTLKASIENINQLWLDTQQLNRVYPFDLDTGRTYIHTLPRGGKNLCGNGDNILELFEANYAVYFNPMSSFIIGRRDICKASDHNVTGQRSAIGFTFDPTTPKIILNSDVVRYFELGQQSEKYILLSWHLTKAENIVYTKIQRSRDAMHWVTIYQEPTVTNKDISHLDELTETGDYYYRLEFRDARGESSFSTIKSISFQSTQKIYQIYPNPIREGELTLSGNIVKGGYCSIVNQQGQVVLEQRITTSSQQLSLAIPQFLPGVYFLKLYDEQGQQAFIRSILVQ